VPDEREGEFGWVLGWFTRKEGEVEHRFDSRRLIGQAGKGESKPLVGNPRSGLEFLDSFDGL